MDYQYSVIYKKRNGQIFVRYRKTSPLTDKINIGDETSMGWTILDIYYFINNVCYSFVSGKKK